jgi:hypothetical protein
MLETLSKQEQDYLLQVLLTRPLGEALPVYLKLTGQQLVSVNGSQPMTPMPTTSAPPPLNS